MFNKNKCVVIFWGFLFLFNLGLILSQRKKMFNNLKKLIVLFVQVIYCTKTNVQDLVRFALVTIILTVVILQKNAFTTMEGWPVVNDMKNLYDVNCLFYLINQSYQ